MKCVMYLLQESVSLRSVRSAEGVACERAVTSDTPPPLPPFSLCFHSKGRGVVAGGGGGGGWGGGGGANATG